MTTSETQMASLGVHVSTATVSVSVSGDSGGGSAGWQGGAVDSKRGSVSAHDEKSGEAKESKGGKDNPAAQFQRQRSLGPAYFRQLSIQRPPMDPNSFGVAFSGGGVRSAYFQIGVLEQLAEPNEKTGERELDKVTYLSSVSGGGYTSTGLFSYVEPGDTPAKAAKRFVDGILAKDKSNPSYLDGFGSYLLFGILFLCLAVSAANFLTMGTIMVMIFEGFGLDDYLWDQLNQTAYNSNGQIYFYAVTLPHPFVDAWIAVAAVAVFFILVVPFLLGLAATHHKTWNALFPAAEQNPSPVKQTFGRIAVILGGIYGYFVIHLAILSSAYGFEKFEREHSTADYEALVLCLQLPTGLAALWTFWIVTSPSFAGFGSSMAFRVAFTVLQLAIALAFYMGLTLWAKFLLFEQSWFWNYWTVARVIALVWLFAWITYFHKTHQIIYNYYRVRLKDFFYRPQYDRLRAWQIEMGCVQAQRLVTHEIEPGPLNEFGSDGKRKCSICQNDIPVGKKLFMCCGVASKDSACVICLRSCVQDIPDQKEEDKKERKECKALVLCEKCHRFGCADTDVELSFFQSPHSLSTEPVPDYAQFDHIKEDKVRDPLRRAAGFRAMHGCEKTERLYFPIQLNVNTTANTPSRLCVINENGFDLDVLDPPRDPGRGFCQRYVCGPCGCPDPYNHGPRRTGLEDAEKMHLSEAMALSGAVLGVSMGDITLLDSLPLRLVLWVLQVAMGRYVQIKHVVSKHSIVFWLLQFALYLATLFIPFVLAMTGEKLEAAIYFVAGLIIVFGWAASHNNFRNFLLISPFWRAIFLITGTAMPKNPTYVYLSDGGHYENLAVLKLFANKCKKVYCFDAGADPELQLPDLYQALHAAKDWGLISSFQFREHRGSPKDVAMLPKNKLPDSIARSGDRVICVDLEYTDKEHKAFGTLWYVKSTLTGRESDRAIHLHALQSEEFPHDSTANQFLSHRQMDAYRRLGNESVKELQKLISDPEMVPEINPFSPRHQYGVVHQQPSPAAAVSASLSLSALPSHSTSTATSTSVSPSLPLPAAANTSTAQGVAVKWHVAQA